MLKDDCGHCVMKLADVGARVVAEILYLGDFVDLARWPIDQ
jgi:hypothetical protein